MLSTSAVLFFLALLAIAVILKPLSEALRLPFPVLLVVAGFAGSEIATRVLGVDTGIHWQNLQTIIFYGLIPVLIFRAAASIDPQNLRRELFIILLLALPLMLLSAATIAVTVYFGINHSGFPWLAALITGALLSATDPAAVITLMQRTGAPERLSLLLEGESLFNDATAIVLFSLFIGMANAGMVESGIWLNTVIRFLSVFLGGLAIGVLVAALAVLLTRFIRAHDLQGLVSFICVYAAFLVAEDVFHLSGVMAVLAVGLVFGELGRRTTGNYDQPAVDNFWSVVAGMAEILIFLLAGISITLSMFTEQWLAMLIGIVAVLLARALAVYAGLPVVNIFSAERRLSIPDRAVIFWGGVRGAVTLALALSIPLTLDYWYTIQSIAYGVVLFTLFFQATSMPLLVRKAFRGQ